MLLPYSDTAETTSVACCVPACYTPVTASFSLAGMKAYYADIFYYNLRF